MCFFMGVSRSKIDRRSELVGATLRSLCPLKSANASSSHVQSFMSRRADPSESQTGRPCRLPLSSSSEQERERETTQWVLRRQRRPAPSRPKFKHLCSKRQSISHRPRGLNRFHRSGYQHPKIVVKRCCSLVNDLTKGETARPSRSSELICAEQAGNCIEHLST